MRNSAAASRLMPTRLETPVNRERLRAVLRVVMAAFYAGAGVAHLRSPAGFLPITPDWVPFPHEVILATGLCELAGAIGLLGRRFRWWAGVMLALYAACVFPANIKHAVENIQLAGFPTSWWYNAPRLALQPVLVWWALFSAGVINWPRKPQLRRAP